MAQVRYCHNCGEKMEDSDDRFCSNCGISLDEEPVAGDLPVMASVLPSTGKKLFPKWLLAVAVLVIFCATASLGWWYLAGHGDGAGSLKAGEQPVAKTGPVASSDEALARLQELPEIKRWQSEIKSVQFEVMEETERFVIRVFEVVKDGGSGHTAVLGWFAVDKKSGKAFSIDNEILAGGQRLTDPKVYLPKPNMKYTVFQQFADGDQGTMGFVTAKVSNVAIVSEVEIVRNPGEEQLGFVQHYLIRKDGIYSVYDTNVEQAVVWLKNDLYEGMQWEQYGIKSKVVRIGVPCDLGFLILQDCLVVEEHNTSVDVHYEHYYAAGHGLVLTKDLRSGKIRYIVRSITSMESKQAEEMVRRYSPNRELLKNDPNNR